MKRKLLTTIAKTFIATIMLLSLNLNAQGYYNLQYPATGSILETESLTTYAQVWQDGATEAPGPAAGMEAWIGISPKGQNTNPDTWTTWIPATFNVQVGNNDEFSAAIGSNLAPGTYYYASRFRYNNGGFVYGGFSGGAWNGTSNVSGVLTVSSNPDCTTVWYADADGDGYGDISSTKTGCNQPEGYVGNSSDCNDNDMTVYHFGDLFIDNDGDSYGSGIVSDVCYGDVPSGFTDVSLGEDCNDSDANIFQLGNFYVDADGDDYGDSSTVVENMCYGAEEPDGFSLTSLGIDCNDNDNSVFQSASLYIDSDGDGYDNGFDENMCIGSEMPDGFSATTLGIDCDDENSGINPGAMEIDGNGIDENCNGMEDEGAGMFYTALKSRYCGSTLEKIYTVLSASVSIENVTLYHFRITSPDGSFETLTTSNSYFQLTDLLNYDYGTTYSVSVGVDVNDVWQGWGEACDVTTPSLFEGNVAIVIPQCGTTLPRAYNPIMITGPNFIESYEIRVTNMTTLQQATLTRNVPYFSIKMLPSIYDYNTTYSIEVRVRTVATHDYSDWTSECMVSTPASQSAFAMQGSESGTAAFKAVAYPNPYVNSFAVNFASKTNASVQIKVYDMLGHLIDTRNVLPANLEAQRLGANYPSGIYNVVVTQGETIKTMRVIKR